MASKGGGGEGAGTVARGLERRASGMCNRLHTVKDATWDEMLRFFDSLHQDNLPVQPVAQRPGIERSR